VLVDVFVSVAFRKFCISVLQTLVFVLFSCPWLPVCFISIGSLHPTVYSVTAWVLGDTVKGMLYVSLLNLYDQ
jgi:hypothetical protein